MAEAFPASRFVGVDYHAESDRDRAAARREAGVADRVTFEVAGAADFAGEGYDLVGVLRRLPRPRRPARGGAHGRGARAGRHAA